MDDDAPRGVHTVTMADIPFDAVRQHWASLSTWPPHMAVAWVAEPTWEEIVAQARRQTGTPRMREASEAVLTALIDGRLIAYGMRVDKTLGRRPPEKITPDEWQDLIWMGGTLSTAALNKYTGAEVFCDVQIDRLGLLSLWPDAEIASASTRVNEGEGSERQSPASEDAIDVPFREVQDDVPSEMLMLPGPLTKQERLNSVAASVSDICAGLAWEDRKGSRYYPFWVDLKRVTGLGVTREEASEAWKHYHDKRGRGRPQRTI